MQVEIKVLDARLDGLAYATPGAAAVDLRACSVIESNDPAAVANGPLKSKYILQPGAKFKIGTGIAIHLGSLSEALGNPYADPFVSAASLLLPRSGAGWRGFSLANTVGLIDSDYQGELILAARNNGTTPIVIDPLERLAQMMLVPVLTPEYKVVAEFSATTARGTGGFGSTGSA